MIPIEVVIDRPGMSPLRLTPSWDTFTFSTSAIGGFADASFRLPGDPARWKREIPHLALVRIVLDTFIIWEGQVEDVGLSLGGDIGATISCFGLRKRLEETSIRRIWTKREIPWVDRNLGVAAYNGAWVYSSGQYDPADLTKVGFQYGGTGQGPAIPLNIGFNAWYLSPSGVDVKRVMGSVDISGGGAGANWRAEFFSYAAGAFTLESFATATGTFNVQLSGFEGVAMGPTIRNAIGYTPATTDTCAFRDLRILGTLTEDASGGFYGGTILRDLIALVPGLSIGIIDSGSDYTIQAIERAVRSSALSVVEEVAGYYTREWGVWEDGRFDWRAVNKDEPQWMCELSDLQPGSELTSSVDGLAKTIYILYTDAASQRDAESSSVSTSQRNPYVKQGKTDDVLVSPGFQMTSSSSSQLASKFVGDVGNYPAIRGSLVLPALVPVKRANGPNLPALQIRGGDNILVSDLPKTDLFATGRDGETLFHIVSTQADLGSGLVTLEIEGQTRRMDVLLARLALSTQFPLGNLAP